MRGRKILFIISCFVLSSFLASSAFAAEEGQEPWQGAYTSAPFGGGELREAYCDLVSMVEGSFGGLLFSVAGLVAVAMAVFGEGGQTKNVFVVSIGALTISTMVSLYFGDMGCGNGSSTGATNKSAAIEAPTEQKAFKLPLLSNSDDRENTIPQEEAETEESEAELF